MERNKLVLQRRAVEYVQKYAPLFGLEGWVFRVEVRSEKETPSSSPLITPMSSCNMRGGERKAVIYINADIRWNDWWNDLEHSVLHELFHVMAEECGIEEAIKRAIDAMNGISPPQAVVVKGMLEAAVEVLADRTASLAREAYGKAGSS